MFEQGTATIVNGTGRIATQNPPQPVSFTPHHFPNVVPGPVIFKRFPNSPAWASQVIPAPGFLSRVTAATPAAGFTAAAERLVCERAFISVLEAQAAQGTQMGGLFDQFEHDRFGKLGALQSKATARDVRKFLG